MRNIGRLPGSMEKENYYRWIRSNRFKSTSGATLGLPMLPDSVQETKMHECKIYNSDSHPSPYQVQFKITDITALDPRATRISSFGFGCSDEIEVRDVCARKQGYFDSFLQPSTSKVIPFPVAFDTTNQKALAATNPTAQRRQSAKGLVAASLEAPDEEHTEHNQASAIEDADTVTS